MIVYTLRCEQGHGFDSWFQSSAAFEALAGAGHLACPQCGDGRIVKAPMAPAVAAGDRRGPDTEARDDPSGTGPGTIAGPVPPGAVQGPAVPVSLARPSSDLERAIAALRREVEARSDYVGSRFAQEARAMHLGDAPERAIYGEARPEEARQLAEEGVPILPLPFIPGRKTN